jgi:NAD(P)-dependent dehydrogenase (short-subunit alcohol dehydrogenase family)
MEKTTAFISRNRTAIAVVLAFAGTTFVLVRKSKKEHNRKRRAKKLRGGGKKEVVVLACSSFHDPLTKSLALDLERRGYIVYITVSTTEEDSLIQSEAKADVRPLWIDLTSTTPNPLVDIHPNLEPIKELLMRPTRSSSPGHASTAGVEPLSLAGLVILPGTSGYPIEPLIHLAPNDINDTINTRVLSPILTVQQFLPLLSRFSLPSSPSSIVFAYPSIPRSLDSPNQIPEVITAACISSLTQSLRREIKAANASITLSELCLGNFDVAPRKPEQALTQQNHWHSSHRASTPSPSRAIIKGSSTRDFHNAVFDALAPAATFRPFGLFDYTASKPSGAIYVGSGARFYAVVGSTLPSGLVGWMMGYYTPHTKRSPQRDVESDAAKQVRNVWGDKSMAASSEWEQVYKD